MRNCLKIAKDYLGEDLIIRPKTEEEHKKRAENMALLHKFNMTLAEVGSIYGLTRQRVAQIFVKYNLDTMESTKIEKISVIKQEYGKLITSLRKEIAKKDKEIKELKKRISTLEKNK